MRAKQNTSVVQMGLQVASLGPLAWKKDGSMVPRRGHGSVLPTHHCMHQLGGCNSRTGQHLNHNLHQLEFIFSPKSPFFLLLPFLMNARVGVQVLIFGMAWSPFFS